MLKILTLVFIIKAKIVPMFFGWYRVNIRFIINQLLYSIAHKYVVFVKRRLKLYFLIYNSVQRVSALDRDGECLVIYL